MRLADFDFDLPESFIAQEPVEPRDSSKLMRLNRQTDDIQHHIFRDIVDMLAAGDVMVMNNTRVIPARLHAKKVATGGKVEILLLRQLDDTQWRVLIGGRNVHLGMILKFDESEITVEIAELLEGAQRIVKFSRPVNDLLSDLGENAPTALYPHSLRRCRTLPNHL